MNDRGGDVQAEAPEGTHNATTAANIEFKRFWWVVALRTSPPHAQCNPTLYHPTNGTPIHNH